MELRGSITCGKQGCTFYLGGGERGNVVVNATSNNHGEDGAAEKESCTVLC